ncbi:hypothetical protein CLV62_101314 [Dysgonomonas alginatilytica]|uniref:Uncharacterized protein n=1 Tax=Dysgonomonas alginatilytica TaxID=1605892 RepID=A0A2V3Q137_9BACT|nr:hypothetical protein [Dysgonomonas alginatilytica]PXV69045.1 hypothetical protein CLV62_101314 [Dysgonomonas alginatilytica]
MKKYLLFFFITVTFTVFSQGRKDIKPDRIIDVGAMGISDKFQIALDCSTEKLSSWSGLNKLVEEDCGTIQFGVSQNNSVTVGSSFYFEIFYNNTSTSGAHLIGVKGTYK